MTTAWIDIRGCNGDEIPDIISRPRSIGSKA
jgi:hypothetical protein